MTLSLRDVKHSLTEQTIVEKATGLFAEHGYAQVSVRQIAKAAMVSEKTVFNYFPYKELIVLAGSQPTMDAFMTETQAQIDAITDPAEVLRDFGARLADICAANPETMAIVVSELLTLDAQRLTLAMRYIPDLYGPIRTIMTLARAQGKLRSGISVESATDLFLSNVLTVVRTYFASGHADRVKPMLNTTSEIFLHGAFLEPGPEKTLNAEDVR